MPSSLTRADHHFHGTVSGWAPVQGFGLVAGRPWYFYARYGGWLLLIAQATDLRPEELAGAEDTLPGWLVAGDSAGASWLPHEEAWALIESGLRRFLDGELPLRNARSSEGRASLTKAP